MQKRKSHTVGLLAYMSLTLSYLCLFIVIILLFPNVSLTTESSTITEMN